MNHQRVLSAAVVAGLALAGPGLAGAQQFPADDAYEPFPCGDAPMFDARRDEPDAIDAMDVVGDEDAPAGQRAADADFLYLRLRIDRDPTVGTALMPGGWGFAFDLDADFDRYDRLVTVDGEAGRIEVYRNTQTTFADDPSDPADEPPAFDYDFATHGQVGAAADSSFGDDDDFFVDLAVPWADLADVDIGPTTIITVWAGTSEVPGALDGDLACHDAAAGAPSLSGSGGESVADPDVDSDGDGVPDADEVEGGSDPDDPGSVPGGGVARLEGGGGCHAASSAPGAALALLALVFARRRRGLSRGLRTESSPCRCDRG